MLMYTVYSVKIKKLLARILKVYIIIAYISIYVRRLPYKTCGSTSLVYRVLNVDEC